MKHDEQNLVVFGDTNENLRLKLPEGYWLDLKLIRRQHREDITWELKADQITKKHIYEFLVQADTAHCWNGSFCIHDMVHLVLPWKSKSQKARQFHSRWAMIF